MSDFQKRCDNDKAHLQSNHASELKAEQIQSERNIEEQQNLFLKENIQAEKLGEKFKKDLEEIRKVNEENLDKQKQVY